MAGAHEPGKEIPGSMQYGEFPERLRNY